MGALKAFAAALAFVAAVLSFTAQGREDTGEVRRWQGLAGEAADRFGIPVDWVMRVIDAESAGRTSLGGRPITSHAGAMGLMQIMPATWASLRAQYGLGSDPHDPRDNIVAGTAYLRAMYDRFGYPGLFGAYNAGPGRYGEYVSEGRPLPRETRDYMAKVTGELPPPAGGRGQARRAVAPTFPPAADSIFLTRNGIMARAPWPVSGGMQDDRNALRAVGPDAPRRTDSLFAVRRDGGTAGE